MRLVDTHCHLDLDAFAADRAEVVARARRAGVDRMIVVGFEPERWETGARLAREVPEVRLALGLHPTEAERYDDALEEELRRRAVALGAVAIGETGMDFHWKTATPEAQAIAFRRQIELARELGLPFVVHQRDAAEATLAILRAAGGPLHGVMHCFTGDLAYAEACLELGLHLGLGGAVTFRKEKQLQEAVRRVPLGRLLLETDAPYMTPSPHRGQRNEPAYVELVARRVAEIREEDPERIAEATSANAAELFGPRLFGAE